MLLIYTIYHQPALSAHQVHLYPSNIPPPNHLKKKKNNTYLYEHWNTAYSFFWYIFMGILLKIWIENNFFLWKREQKGILLFVH